MSGIASSPLYFATGLVAGLLYFGGLWWNTQRFAAGGRLGAMAALMACRFILLAGLLFLASRQGALPLLTMAAGIVIARFIVMRRVRAGGPS